MYRLLFQPFTTARHRPHHFGCAWNSPTADTRRQPKCVSSPLLITKCAAVSLWRLETGDEERDWQVIVRITLPGQGPQDFPTNFRARAGTLRHRVTQRIYGLPLLEQGEVRFELLLNGEHAADHIVTVARQDASGLRPGAPRLA